MSMSILNQSTLLFYCISRPPRERHFQPLHFHFPIAVHPVVVVGQVFASIRATVTFGPVLLATTAAEKRTATHTPLILSRAAHIITAYPSIPEPEGGAKFVEKK